MQPFRTIRLGGYSMRLDFGDNASFKYFSDRENYEKAELNAFIGCVIRNPAALVIDIGANYGAYTLAAANLSRYGVASTILAIEPDPRPCAALRASAKLNHFDKYVRVFPNIVSDHNGDETLYINARSSADNRTGVVTTAPISIHATRRVQARTVDQILEESSVDKRKQFIIKMDIQGNEPRALAGMKELIAQCDGFILFFEHCRYLIDSAQCSYNDYLMHLAALEGDEFYRIEKGTLRKLPGRAGSGFQLLLKEFEELDRQVETKMQGSGGNFVIVRGLTMWA